MRFTVNITMMDPAHYLPLARAAEEAGFYAVSVPDSIFYPEETVGEYPYHDNREFLEDKPFIEPFVAIPAMAAVTTKLRFTTFVLKMAIREPLLVAKTVYSAAVLSGERVTLGVGISPWYEDFIYCNTPWEDRGTRLDEMIEIFKGMGSGDYFEYHGKHFDFKRLKMCPVTQQPVPVIVGGHAKPALRRAARLGDGWVSANVSREELKGMVDQLNVFRAEYGTDKHPDYQIQAMLSDIDPYDVDGYRGAAEACGVTEFMTAPWGAYDMKELSLQDKIDYLKRFGDEVIAKY